MLKYFIHFHQPFLVILLFLFLLPPFQQVHDEVQGIGVVAVVELVAGLVEELEGIAEEGVHTLAHTQSSIADAYSDENVRETMSFSAEKLGTFSTWVACFLLSPISPTLIWFLGVILLHRNSGILLSHKVVLVHIGSGFSKTWKVCEDSLLPVEVVDKGLEVLVIGCPNLLKLAMIGTSELGLLSVAKEFLALQELGFWWGERGGVGVGVCVGERG
jgi:hypothetical protein